MKKNVFGMPALLAGVAGFALALPVLAQPAVDEDLGTITEFTPTTITRTVTFDAVNNPVQWYQIVLPAAVNPTAFLDLFTHGATVTDTEIGLYRADGTLVDSDDDDGASTFSALSYGSTNVAFPGRVNPIINGTTLLSASSTRPLAQLASTSPPLARAQTRSTSR
jgi:hypothetical protein